LNLKVVPASVDKPTQCRKNTVELATTTHHSLAGELAGRLTGTHNDLETSVPIKRYDSVVRANEEKKG
jgi:hypothetical protein